MPRTVPPASRKPTALARPDRSGNLSSIWDSSPGSIVRGKRRPRRRALGGVRDRRPRRGPVTIREGAFRICGAGAQGRHKLPRSLLGRGRNRCVVRVSRRRPALWCRSVNPKVEGSSPSPGAFGPPEPTVRQGFPVSRPSRPVGRFGPFHTSGSTRMGTGPAQERSRDFAILGSGAARTPVVQLIRYRLGLSSGP